MATTELVSARADLACSNCGTTQTHTLTMFFDDTENELVIERKCVCFDGDTKYKETFRQSIPEEA